MMKMSDRLSIQARRIRERRIALGLSQEQLADAIQTVQATVSRYERGENDPTAEVIATLARVLHTSSDWLLGLSENVSISISSESDLTDTEKEILEVIRTSTPNKQKVIINILKEIVSISSSPFVL
jgi:transcriptional regulator with XRE-family HTH domain